MPCVLEGTRGFRRPDVLRRLGRHERVLDGQVGRHAPPGRGRNATRRERLSNAQACAPTCCRPRAGRATSRRWRFTRSRAGADAVLPEEPLAHVNTGYEKAFQELWQKRYGRPWQPQNASPEAQFLTAQLKNELYIQLEQRAGPRGEDSRETGRTRDAVRAPDPQPVQQLRIEAGRTAGHLTGDCRGRRVRRADLDGAGELGAGKLRCAGPDVLRIGVRPVRLLRAARRRQQQEALAPRGPRRG